MRSASVRKAALAGVLFLTFAVPAAAQQAVNFSLGVFLPTGEDGRDDEDVLVQNQELFNVEPRDFRSVSFGAEYLIPVSEFLEASAGFSFSSKEVPSIYADFVRPNGAEIEQDFTLRTLPIAATLRVLPIGRQGVVEPYVGGGLAFIAWRYREEGDFVDFSITGQPIFEAEYEADGTAVAPVAVFGLRVPLDRFAAGGELRWQGGKGDLNDDFLGSEISLGGWTFAGTFAVRF